MSVRHCKRVPNRFHTNPCQDVVAYIPHYMVDQDHLIKEELLSKVAVAEVTNCPQGGLYSKLVLVPKKDSEQRPIMNLKSLNSRLNTSRW